MSAPSTALAARVTLEIRRLLDHGVKPWVQPWSNATALGLPLRANGAPYQGFNIVALWAAAQTHGFTSHHWFTFKQAQALGAYVQRGARATHIIYYSGALTATDDDTTIEAGNTKARPRAILRSYAVFNRAQIDGLPDTFSAKPAVADVADALTAAFARVPATVQHGGARACYDPDADVIRLPPRDAFTTTSQYYATWLHELAHWTGHPTRLDRSFTGPRSATAYAREELVAELTAAFLGAELGLPVDHLECHASYIDHWIKLLDREPSALLHAAGKAQAAATFLRQFLHVGAAQETHGGDALCLEFTS